jgi:hypothetical protein
MDRRRRRRVERGHHGDRCKLGGDREGGGRSLGGTGVAKALLGDNQAGTADDGPIAIDERLDANQPRPERVCLNEQRAGAARTCLGEIEHAARPGNRRQPRVIDGHTGRGGEPFGNRLVEPVEERSRRRGIARRGSDVFFGGDDPRRNRRQGRRARLEAPSHLVFDPRERRFRRGAEALALQDRSSRADQHSDEQPDAGDQHETSGESGALACNHGECSEYTGAIVKSIWT